MKNQSPALLEAFQFEDDRSISRLTKLLDAAHVEAQDLELDFQKRLREAIQEAETKLSQRFAEEQAQATKRTEEEVRKTVTRELLSRFEMELEKLEADFEERRKNAIAATENAAEVRFAQNIAELQAKLEEVTSEKNKLEEELQQSAARWNAEHELLAQQKSSAGAAQAKDVSEAVNAEISRIESMIQDISRQIELNDTDLGAQIRLSRERKELESFLKGLRYSIGEVTFEN